MEEFNFKLTKEEADRVIQSLNYASSSIINKMQEQFAEQIPKKEDEILLEEKVEENPKND